VLKKLSLGVIAVKDGFQRYKLTLSGIKTVYEKYMYCACIWNPDAVNS
jgi:hypothetical protein